MFVKKMMNRQKDDESADRNVSEDHLLCSQCEGCAGNG